MVASHKEFADGELWFFTDRQSRKVDEAESNDRILLTYADWDKQHYVSVDGTAEVVEDRAKIAELWTEGMRTWFPKGVDDPNVALLRVRVESAEYWDAPSSTMLHAYGYLKAVTTGKRPNAGETGGSCSDGQRSVAPNETAALASGRFALKRSADHSRPGGRRGAVDVALAGVVGGPDDALLLHPLHDRGGAVVADLQPALDVGGRGLAVAQHHLHRLIVDVRQPSSASSPVAASMTARRPGRIRRRPRIPCPTGPRRERSRPWR